MTGGFAFVPPALAQSKLKGSPEQLCARGLLQPDENVINSSAMADTDNAAHR
jgi:hypothetical protein